MHITLTAGSHLGEIPAGAETQVDSDSQDELLSEDIEAEDRVPSPSTLRKSSVQSKHKYKSSSATPDISCVQHTETSTDESFPVTVTVDRAMHLNLKGETCDLMCLFRKIQNAQFTKNNGLVSLCQALLSQSTVKGCHAAVFHTSPLTLLNLCPHL